MINKNKSLKKGDLVKILEYPPINNIKINFTTNSNPIHSSILQMTSSSSNAIILGRSAIASSSNSVVIGHNATLVSIYSNLKNKIGIIIERISSYFPTYWKVFVDGKTYKLDGRYLKLC